MDIVILPRRSGSSDSVNLKGDNVAFEVWDLGESRPVGLVGISIPSDPILQYDAVWAWVTGDMPPRTSDPQDSLLSLDAAVQSLLKEVTDGGTV